MIERCSGHDGTYAIKLESFKKSLKIRKPVVSRIEKDEYKISSQKCLNINDNDYAQVCNQWSKGILKIFDEFSRFDWEK